MNQLYNDIWLVAGTRTPFADYQSVLGDACELG
jgi:hypothetical protein